MCQPASLECFFGYTLLAKERACHPAPPLPDFYLRCLVMLALLTASRVAARAGDSDRPVLQGTVRGVHARPHRQRGHQLRCVMGPRPSFSQALGSHASSVHGRDILRPCMPLHAKWYTTEQPLRSILSIEHLPCCFVAQPHHNARRLGEPRTEAMTCCLQRTWSRRTATWAR